MFLNVKNTIEVCVSFMFDIILFSYASFKKQIHEIWQKILLFSVHSASKTTTKKGLNRSFMEIGKEWSHFCSDFLYCWPNQMAKSFLFTYASCIWTVPVSPLNFTHPYFCMRLTFWDDQQGMCRSQELQFPLCFSGFVFWGKKEL